MTRDWRSTGALGLGAIGLGAGLMYLLDPDAGRRRRSQLGQRAGSLGRRAGERGSRVVRDLGHRGQGLLAAASRPFREEDSDKERLAARVRSELGRVVSHARAIDVSVEEGLVTLAGPILASEAEAALEAARGTRGVDVVDDRLDRYDTPDWVPELQGGSAMRRGDGERRFSPMGLVAGASAAALVAYGIRRRSARGLVRARQSVMVDAPVLEVFDQWSQLENFPFFMSGVKEVRDSGRSRSHWRVEGPGGMDVEWDAETTAFEPGRRIGWKSVAGSQVPNWGEVRFEPLGEDATRVTVDLCYRPPAGEIGHVAASLFGADPQSRLDEDLLRMKTFIESGPATGSRGEPARDMLNY
jgi:uncharacterized membrane protein